MSDDPAAAYRRALNGYNNKCAAGYFDLSVQPRLEFFAHKNTTRRSRLENELQCDGCRGSGLPSHVNCTNSNTDGHQTHAWSCVGTFSDPAFVVSSDFEIDCESDDTLRDDCVKAGSCVLRFHTERRYAGVDWLLLFLVSHVLVILLVVVALRARKKMMSMRAERRATDHHESCIDIIEERRRGREEARRLRELPQTAGADSQDCQAESRTLIAMKALASE
ncbi:uncharacterized protein LOC100905296 [Galendromus occidentalis]|uniref:Uncharacterized protein LOC100905296 n=1 Tax=Galendromus occidentalis TaxID=34638 RepID=A0AAJ6VZM0_9ACAR|nr:uncharacterized protein LOC100905296 [Galendromus occidentalis]